MTFEKLIQVLQTIGIFLIVFTIYQTYNGQKLERDIINTSLQFERKKEALKLWEIWDNTFSSNQGLRNTMKLLEAKSTRDQINWDSVVNANPADKQLFALKNDCITLLNLFENIAVAYNYNIADTTIIIDGFKDLVFDFGKKLGPFINSYKDSRDGKGWPSFDLLIKKWEYEGRSSKPDMVN